MRIPLTYYSIKTILTVVHLSLTMTQNNVGKILLKRNFLCAIKVIKENKKWPDCQSICHYIHKFSDSKTSVDYS